MSNILLMNLPVITNSYRTVMPPMGLQYIASNIKGGHIVRILDLVMTYDSITYLGENNLHATRYLSGEVLKKIFDSFKPGVLGISCNFSYQHRFLEQTIKAIRKFAPNIKIVIGGNHVTAYYQKKYPPVEGVDAVILGEGEEAFNDYLEGKLDQGKFHQVKDLDSLKFPLRDEGMEAYFKANLQHFGTNTPGARVVVMITSRGCAYNCVFCSVRNIWGRGIRFRSAENVLAEIDEIVNKYRATEIHFEDDNLLFNKDRCLKIFKGMEKYKIRWTCPNGVDLSKLDDEVIEAMKASGCYRITICPETVTDRILKFYRKPFNFETIKEKTALIRKHDINLVGYFIIGAPDETYNEMIDTLRFAAENFDDLSLSCLSPYIGTDLYDYCEKNDLFINGGPIKEGFLNLQADVVDTFKRGVTSAEMQDVFSHYAELLRRKRSDKC